MSNTTIKEKKYQDTGEGGGQLRFLTFSIFKHMNIGND